MFRPVDHHESTYIATLPREIQEELFQYTCPYTATIEWVGNPIRIRLSMSTGNVYINFSRSMATRQKVLEFVGSIEKLIREDARWVHVCFEMSPGVQLFYCDRLLEACVDHDSWKFPLFSVCVYRCLVDVLRKVAAMLE